MNHSSQNKENGSKISGCQIKNGKTVMLMIQVLVCLKTMEILENKNKAMLDVYSSIAFSSFILFSINIFSNSLKKNCRVPKRMVFRRPMRLATVPMGI